MGIGTQTPAEKLHVFGNITTTANITAKRACLSYSYVSNYMSVPFLEADNIAVTGLVDGRDISADGDVLDSLVVGSGGDTTNDVWTGTTDTYTTAGDVSIGTSNSEGNRLNVKGYSAGKAAVRGINSRIVGVFFYTYAEGLLGAVSPTGLPTTPGHVGVLGRKTSSGDPGVGVYAWNADDADENIALYAVADGENTESTNYGVYATAIGGSTNYVGYFDGDVKVDGRLTLGNTEYIEECGIHCVNLGGASLGIGTDSPQDKLHVAGWFLRVDGAENEQAYMGGMEGDNMGVMIGSHNSLVQDVTLWNRASNNYMELSVGVLHIKGGADLAEPFAIHENHNRIKAGMLLSIDPDRPGKLKISDKPYDHTVAGIVSGAGGINPGVTMMQDSLDADDSVPVTLTGRVYAWADASVGAIDPGDLLTTSDIPGYAMRVDNHAKAAGAIIGKAMTSLDHGQGLIPVLVSLQ